MFIVNLFNGLYKNSSTKESEEKLTLLSPQANLQFDETQVQSVLSDFEKLEFKDNKCFDKIADDYEKKGESALFNYVILNKQREIMDILDKKLTSKDQEELKENFKKRLGRYLLRIDEGMNDAKEFLNKDDLIGFFDGCYWPDKKAGHLVNHYDNLSINITKPGQSLETSRLFSKKTKRVETIKNEIQRVKIYSNDKRIVTIEKNEKQQRNYSFTEFAICDIEISWGAKDESGKDLNCAVVLNINLGQVSIKKSTIDGKDVEPKEILELAKQNEAVLIKGKALHEVLAAHFIKQTPCEEKKSTQSHENIVVPGSGAPGSAIGEGITIEHPYGKAANKDNLGKM
ncbi:hypothetical protein [Wolbachia endosymbiont (group A) of Bombylius major]|uniref:hypothetical protein n=1 Tax=Wolbachia endosymbiont (group A) of Bombylius major TaxID=2953988 RepID=UPI002230D53B|nr:hypothetical protein [Wolbachia endosymbiont (group A) of Bombylius major]